MMGRDVNGLQATLDRYDDDFIAICCLRSNLTKPMVLAKYVSTESSKDPKTDYHHYGLGFDIYTHFTSPIRRYADLIVHRLLQAALEAEKQEGKGGGHCPYEVEEIKKICDNCNSRKWNADKAQENSDRIFLCKYLRKQPGGVLVCDAIVSEIFNGGAEIIIPTLALEGKVYFDIFTKTSKPKDGVSIELGYKGKQFEMRSLDVVEVEVGVAKGGNPLFPEIKCKLIVESVVGEKAGRGRGSVKERKELGKEMKEACFKKKEVTQTVSSERDPSLRM